MDSDLTRLTVFFEAPFWVGMFERFEGGTLSVCRIVFGAEPKDYDVFVCAEKLHAAAIQSGCCSSCQTGCSKSEAHAAGDPKGFFRLRRGDKGAAGTAAAAGGAEAGTKNAHPRAAGRGKTAEIRPQTAEAKEKAPGSVTVRPLHGRQCLYCRTWRGRIVLGEKAAARVSGGFGVRYWGCP